MQSALIGNEVAIAYSKKFREYGIRYLDGTSSVQTIQFCPWCGASLPGSLRHDWFSAVEGRGVDPFGSDLPSEFTPMSGGKIGFDRG